MYVCMYVCIYIYIYIYILYTQKHTHECMCVLCFSHRSVCKCAVNLDAYMHKEYVPPHGEVHIHTNMHTCIHTTHESSSK